MYCLTYKPHLTQLTYDIPKILINFALKSNNMNDTSLSHNYYRIILCTFAIGFFFYFPLYSQINIKTGYSISYLNPEVNNTILADFNETNEDWLDNTFNDRHWFNGLHLGIRYKVDDIVGIELGWVTQFGKTLAEGVEPVSEEGYYRKLNYSLNQFSFGLEPMATEFLGFGASIDYNLFAINSRDEPRSSKVKIVRDGNWSSHFFITYYTRSNNGIALGIRPFVRVPWTEVDYTGLPEDLEVSAPDGGNKDKNLHFGLSILFFNGN